MISKFSIKDRNHNKNTVSGRFNPFALRKSKIVYNFGLSECNRVKTILYSSIHICNEYFKISGSDSELKPYSGHLLKATDTNVVETASPYVLCIHDI